MNTKNVILVTAIAAVLLVAAVGSASATTVINDCDFHANTSNEDYVLGQNLTCDPAETAIWVEANGVTIDGYNATDYAYYKISGNLSGAGLTYGVFANAQDDVTIKNLEVDHFDMGIRIKAFWDGSLKTCLSWSNRPTIDNCTVHDCGEDTFATHGIQLVCAPDGSITNCEVYNNIGNVSGACGDGGAGIQLFGKSSNTIVDNNVVYNNRLAGISSKAKCQNCNITNNTVFENGMVLPAGLAYFGGGIRFQCKGSANELIINNTVTDNIGPGIFIGGNDCTLRNNTVTGSKDANLGANARGDGLRNDRDADAGGKRTKLYNNTFCWNEHLDINVENAAQNVVGDNNTCDNGSNYNDTSANPPDVCVNPCDGEEPDLIIKDIVPFCWCCYRIPIIMPQKGGDGEGEGMPVMFIDNPELAKELGDEKLREQVAKALAEDPELAAEIAVKLAGDDTEALAKFTRKPVEFSKAEFAEASEKLISNPELVDSELIARCCCRSCNSIKETRQLCLSFL